MSRSIDPREFRTPAFPIEDIFWRRWSPRAMSGEEVSDRELSLLFEAARWAPSTYNEQEWRFLYSKKGGNYWELFFNLLYEANQAWCDRAGALVVVLSHSLFSLNGKVNPVHTFDAGAAFQNLALQGSAMGLVVHGMAGFDYDRARNDLKVPEEYKVEAMIAVGHPGSIEDLPEELRKREQPSDRKPIAEIAWEGIFPKD